MLVNTRSWLSGHSGDGRRVRLSAAHDEWNHVGIALAGIDQGFFAEEGLADIELVTFPGEAEALLDREAAQVRLIAEGAVDIGIDPRTTFVLEAHDQGEPVAIVAARRRNHAFVLFGQKSLTTIGELRGATLITGHRGGANDVMLRQVLHDSGLVPDEDVTIEYIGGPMHDSFGVAQAFREGRYGPAVLAPTAEIERFTAEGFPVLADLRVLYPSRHDRVTAANTNFVNEHPELLKAFLRGMIRSCRYVLDPQHGPAFRDLVVRAGFLTTESELESFDDLFGGWQSRGTRDLALPREGVDLIVHEAQQAGQLSDSFQTDQVLRLDILAQAQRELIEA